MRFIGSARSTAVLLLILFAVLFAGAVSPQRFQDGSFHGTEEGVLSDFRSYLDAVELSRVYSSPVLTFLLSVLLINQSVAIVRRMLLLKTGAFAADKQGYFLAASSFLLHVGLLVALIGIALVLLTRFSGTVDLAEGEAYTGDLRRYHEFPRIPKFGSFPNTRFLVERIEPVIRGDRLRSLNVTIRDYAGRPQQTDIGRPYKAGSVSVLVREPGIAPLFVLKNRKGKELDGAFIKMSMMREEGEEFSLAGVTFKAEFYPDYFIENGIETSRSLEMRNPVFRLFISKDNKFIAKKTIRKNETIDFQNYRLAFPEMRYWVLLYVEKENGLSVLCAGISLLVAGFFCKVWQKKAVF